MSHPPITRPAVTERGYHNKKAAYILPNDSPEHNRLEAQAEGLRRLAGDKVIHAPLSASAVRKALDIGCGTGVVTHELSSKFPDAQVYGIDLTPVPAVREKLPNTEYIEDDMFNLANPENPDPRFSPASFDFVFSRLLIAGMTEWKKYVETCVSLAAPGGWVEMHDFDMPFRQLPKDTPPNKRDSVLSTNPSLADLQREPVPEMRTWQKTISNFMEAKGLDISCGKRLPQLFADAGLEDIHIRRILVPFGSHDDLTDAEKQYTPQSKKILTTMMPDMARKMQADLEGVSDADVDETIRETREHLDTWDGRRDYAWFCVAWGRKPL